MKPRSPTYHFFVSGLVFMTAVAWSCGRHVVAETISYSSAFSITGNNSPSVTFAKFNPSLGTLTGISLTFTGTAAGTFSVTDTDPDLDTSVNGLTDRLRLSFVSLASGTFLAATTTVTANVSPALPVSIAEGQTATFTLGSSILNGVTAADVYAQVGALAADTYFIGASGSVTAAMRQLFSLNTDAAVAPTTNFNGVTANGNATLTYIYAVPEPPSIMLAALGVGLGAVAVRRRRAGRDAGVVPPVS